MSFVKRALRSSPMTWPLKWASRSPTLMPCGVMWTRRSAAVGKGASAEEGAFSGGVGWKRKGREGEGVGEGVREGVREEE